MKLKKPVTEQTTKLVKLQLQHASYRRQQAKSTREPKWRLAGRKYSKREGNPCSLDSRPGLDAVREEKGVKPGTEPAIRQQ
jgi:hypothetical protein